MKVFLSLFLLITLLSCGAKEKNKTAKYGGPDKCNSFPLDAGNYWVYNTVNYDFETGEEKGKKVDTVRVKSKIIKDGNTYFNVGMYAFRNKDCHTVVVMERKSTHAEVELRNDVDLNSKEVYNIPHTPQPNGKLGIRVYANRTREMINDYNCYKVEYHLTSAEGTFFNQMYMYLCEGVGLVKMEGYNTRSGKRILMKTMELTSFHAK